VRSIPSPRGKQSATAGTDRPTVGSPGPSRREDLTRRVSPLGDASRPAKSRRISAVVRSVCGRFAVGLRSHYQTSISNNIN
jgi:hypothetical protein